MLKISFSEADIEALRYWRFHHPDPRVQVRLEALYLRSQGVATETILRLCGIAKASFHRYLQGYLRGGIEQLKRIEPYRPHSELADHAPTLEAYFAQHPPATVAEAAAKIEALTGIARKPTQVRQFLKPLGLKPLKVGMIPAKATVAAQEAFKKSLEPRLAEAQAGRRAVFFVDAAHFVFAPFLGVLWCVQRLFVKPPSGRQHLNVLAA
jgi:transposase